MPAKRTRQAPEAAATTENGPVPKKRKPVKTAAKSKAVVTEENESEEPAVTPPPSEEPPKPKKLRQSKKDKVKEESNGGPGKKAKAPRKRKTNEDSKSEKAEKPKSNRTKSSDDAVKSKSTKASAKTDTKTKSVKADVTKKAPPTSKKAAAKAKKTKDTKEVVQNGTTEKEPPMDAAEPSAEASTDQTVSHPSHCHAHGTVLTLGQGDCGQLGLGDSIMERKKPFPVAGELKEKRVVQVVCGGMHTIALTDDGKIYTWGCNDEGALGRKAQNEEDYEPGLVKSMERVKVVQVSAGDSHSAALSNTGKVYCWGVFRDVNGPFGLVSTSPSTTPELVYSSSFNKAVKIVSGNNHVALLTEQGDIYTFGCGEQGQLGRVNERFSSRGGRNGVSMLLSPQAVRFRRTKGVPYPCIDDVFAGAYSTLAVAKDKRMYIWGLNNFGQLGIKDTDIHYLPEKLPNDWLMAHSSGDDAKKFPFCFSSGEHHSVMCASGRVFTMGRKEYGRLGLGMDATEPNQPTEVRPLKNVSSVACGGACSFAITNTGKAYSWGFGTNLQTGNGEEDTWTPTEMTGKHLEGKRVISSSSGGQHTAVLVASDSNSET